MTCVGNSLRNHVISECTCFAQPLVTNNTLLKLLKDENISAKTFCESCVVTCIKFLSFDTEITPIPLRVELFRSADTHPGSRDDDIDDWFD